MNGLNGGVSPARIRLTAIKFPAFRRACDANSAMGKKHFLMEKKASILRLRSLATFTIIVDSYRSHYLCDSRDFDCTSTVFFPPQMDFCQVWQTSTTERAAFLYKSKGKLEENCDQNGISCAGINREKSGEDLFLEGSTWPRSGTSSALIKKASSRRLKFSVILLLYPTAKCLLGRNTYDPVPVYSFG